MIFLEIKLYLMRWPLSDIIIVDFFHIYIYIYIEKVHIPPHFIVNMPFKLSIASMSLLNSTKDKNNPKNFNKTNISL
jgi:hypothetical protein